MKKTNLFSHFISAIFHPLLMPILVLYIIFNLNTYINFSVPPGLRNLLYGLILITTLFLPASIVLWLYRTKKVNDLNINDYQQRRLPYLITALLYFFTYWLVAKTPLPFTIQLLILGSCLAVFITMAVNLFWKISAHMVGIGGAAGAILGVSFRLMIDLHFVFCLIILISGLVAFARMQLGAHSQGQVYVGFLAGFMSELLVLQING